LSAHAVEDRDVVIADALSALAELARSRSNVDPLAGHRGMTTKAAQWE
jgi:hypothetical protein